MRTTRRDETEEGRTGTVDYPPLADSCSRCRGLLVEERFLDMQQSGFMWGAGWRCVNCGNIVVATFLEAAARDHARPAPSPR